MPLIQSDSMCVCSVDVWIWNRPQTWRNIELTWLIWNSVTYENGMKTCFRSLVRCLWSRCGGSCTYSCPVSLYATQHKLFCTLFYISLCELRDKLPAAVASIFPPNCSSNHSTDPTSSSIRAAVKTSAIPNLVRLSLLVVNDLTSGCCMLHYRPSTV